MRNIKELQTDVYLIWRGKMPNVVKTNKGRILDLPVSIKDVMSGESIVSTNSPGGRLYIDDNGKSEIFLRDASLIDDNITFQYICLPLIADQQVDEELDFAAKLRQIRDIDSAKYK